MEFQPYF
jgi:hypothetical protein